MGNEFTWKKLSEKDKEEIKIQAKDILDKFSAKLSEVELGEEPLIIRGNGQRVEGSGSESDLDFKKRILKNAEKKNDDSIIAEVVKW